LALFLKPRDPTFASAAIKHGTDDGAAALTDEWRLEQHLS
jgi:hypothetical protein